MASGSELVLRVTVADGTCDSQFTRSGRADAYPHLPAVGDRVGIEGLAVTGILVMRTFWEHSVHLDVAIDLPRYGWTFEELSGALADAGFARR
jgi:hypothetical protein